MYLFSHFGSCADIVDSPDVTLACTDDNYDLLLWRQTTSLPFLAAIVEALSKHLKEVSKEPTALFAQTVGRRGGGDVVLC